MTDSVDLFSQSKNEQKSSKLAMAASLILPGSGHQYLERNRSALVYFSAEALSIFAFIFCDHYAKKIAQDAAGFAWIHSGAQGPISNADDFYWKLVGNYMDAQDYNNELDLNRVSSDKKITDENIAWHWDDKSSQEKYNSLRSSSRSFSIASTFFLGALVLDRIVAFIDIRSTTRTNKVQHSRIAFPSMTPSVYATPSSIVFSLAGSY